MDSLLSATEHVVLHHVVEILGSVVNTSNEHLANIIFTILLFEYHTTYVGLLKAICCIEMGIELNYENTK